MSPETVQVQLKKLENTLKYCARGTKWLFLETLDQNLLHEFKELPGLSMVESDESDQSAGNVSDPPQKIASILKPLQPAQPVSPPPDIIKQKKEQVPKFDPMEATNLDSLKLRIMDCEKCQLSQTRSSVVFGQGNQNADVLFVGEAPGGDEDRSGLAFVGKAGKLLTQIIHSIGLNREAVYICNIIKCRPPGNRNPNGDEIAACSPFFYKQLEMIKPSLIVSLGNIATKTLIPGALGIMKMRGKLIDYHGIPLIPTFHPSYLLRNQSALPLVWNDMRQIRQHIFKQRAADPAKTHPQGGDSLESH